MLYNFVSYLTLYSMKEGKYYYVFGFLYIFLSLHWTKQNFETK